MEYITLKDITVKIGKIEIGLDDENDNFLGNEKLDEMVMELTEKLKTAANQVIEHDKANVVQENEIKSDLTQTPTRLEFDKFCSLVYDVFGVPGKVAMLFCTANMFYSNIHRCIRNFPLLHLCGNHGTGKTALSNIMMKFFGQHQEPHALHEDSRREVLHAICDKKDLIHVIEFFDQEDMYSLEMLKAAFDNVGYFRRGDDGKDEFFRPDGGVVLITNKKELNDCALMSRVLQVEMPPRYFGEHDNKKYKALLFEAIGSGAGRRARAFLETRILEDEKFNMTQVKVVEDIKNNIEWSDGDERVINNWASVIAASYCVMGNGGYPVLAGEFSDQIYPLIELQLQNMQSKLFDTQSNTQIKQTSLRKTPKSFKKVCSDCGKDFEETGPAGKICPDCKRDREMLKTRSKATEEPVPPEDLPSIDETLAEIDARQKKAYTFENGR